MAPLEESIWSQRVASFLTTSWSGESQLVRLMVVLVFGRPWTYYLSWSSYLFPFTFIFGAPSVGFTRRVLYALFMLLKGALDATASNLASANSGDNCPFKHETSAPAAPTRKNICSACCLRRERTGV